MYRSPLFLLLAGCPTSEKAVDCDFGEIEEDGECVDIESVDTDDTDTTDTTDDTDIHDTATTDTDSWSCDVVVDTVVPASGSIDAYYRGDIEFELSDPEPTATIVAPVAGTTTLDDERVVFTPDAPLAPSTPYTFTLHYCGGSAALSFTTSALGTPMVDPAGLEGMTYTLLIGDMRVLEPQGIGAVLASYLTEGMLIGVVSVDRDTVSTLFGTELGSGGQDTCFATADPGAADFAEAPYLSIGPTDLTVGGSTFPMSLEDGIFEGTFSSDGTYLGGVSIHGMWDTRPLAAVLDETGDPGALCDLAVSFGASCEDCADGEPYCLPFAADQGTAGGAAEAIIEVPADDCPSCESGAPECP